LAYHKKLKSSILDTDNASAPKKREKKKNNKQQTTNNEQIESAK